MSDRDLRRQCSKCHVTAAEDPSLRFHRFPLPGSHCAGKARVWAEYCFPNQDWSDEVSLKKLHLEEKKVICSKHFDGSAYTNNTRERLNHFAIPIGSEEIMLRIKQELESSSKNIAAKTLPSPIQTQKTNITSACHQRKKDSKPKTNRNRVLGALKRWHGAEQVIVSSGVGQQKGVHSPSLSVDAPKTGNQNSTELCKKIRNSLKRLRQHENAKEETRKGIENNNKPSLPQIEIFPGNSSDTEGYLDVDQGIKQEPTEFYDESETPQTTDEPDMKKSKPTRKNPRRKTRKKTNKELIQNSPLEKVFVSTINKPNTDKRPNKANIETSEMPSHFDHTEQLYEFGKYVAEQLMLFDEKDVRSAQAELQDVLTKYRLKYKIMNCLFKPGKLDLDAKRRKTAKSTQVNFDGKKASQSAPRKHSARTVTGVSRVKSAGQSISCKSPKVKNIDPMEQGTSNISSSTVTPLGFVIEPLSVPGGFHISTQRIDSAGTIVTQPVTLHSDTVDSTVTDPELSHPISDETSITDNGASLSISNGTSATETEVSLSISNGASVTESGLSSSISNETPLTHSKTLADDTRAPVLEAESTKNITNRTSITQLVSLADSVQSTVTELDSANVNHDTTSENSETPASELPPAYFTKSVAEKKTFHVKTEVESDNVILPEVTVKLEKEFQRSTHSASVHIF